MEKLRESEETTSGFFKRLVKRSNKFHQMFGHRKGHQEYFSVGKEFDAKALEIGNFSTTRFFSSAFEQWKRIIECYPTLIQAYVVYRETKDDCDQTKYEVCFQYLLFTYLFKNNNYFVKYI